MLSCVYSNKSNPVILLLKVFTVLEEDAGTRPMVPKSEDSTWSQNWADRWCSGTTEGDENLKWSERRWYTHTDSSLGDQSWHGWSISLTYYSHSLWWACTLLCSRSAETPSAWFFTSTHIPQVFGNDPLKRITAARAGSCLLAAVSLMWHHDEPILDRLTGNLNPQFITLIRFTEHSPKRDITWK